MLLVTAGWRKILQSCLVFRFLFAYSMNLVMYSPNSQFRDLFKRNRDISNGLLLYSYYFPQNSTRKYNFTLSIRIPLFRNICNYHTSLIPFINGVIIMGVSLLLAYTFTLMRFSSKSRQQVELPLLYAIKS